MANIMQNVAIYFLREAIHQQDLKNRFPIVSEDILIRLLRKLRLSKHFERYIRHLPREKSTRVLNALINKFRIPWVLVPPEELERKFCQTLLFLTKRNSSEALGDYLEFGVYQGNSLLAMHRALDKLNFNNIRLFGFDSFEGLPPLTDCDACEVWCEGAFKADYNFTKANLTKGGVDWNRVFLEKGFFKSTLNQELIGRHKIVKASVIMIDCDMYSSAKDALTFCAPLIHDQAIIFFDDWNATDCDRGEKKAFAEFLQENPHFKAEKFGTYFLNSQVFFLYRKEKLKIGKRKL